MAECQISSIDLSSLGKSLSSYFPTPESSISSLDCKLQESLEADIFTGSSSSLTGPHRSDGEADREDFPILGSDVSTRKIDMFFDSLTNSNVSSAHNLEYSFDVNSIIPSLNQLGLSSVTASQSSVDQNQLFSGRNIWKSDSDSSSYFSTFSTPETYTHHQTPQMSLQMQLQQQKYLQSLFTMKNSRAPPNLSFGSTASPPSRHWSENFQRIPPSKSLPSLSSPLFPTKPAFLFQHSNSVETQRARLNNMPFPKHLMTSSVGGVKNIISNCEDEFYQTKFSSPTMDADVLNDSSNTSFFNNNNNSWMNSLFGRLPLSELDGSTLDQVVPGILAGGGCSSYLNHRGEQFSRKVFVGGLPPDIDDKEITVAFRRFGPLVVDWPHKTETKSFFPPKGYCFLLFHDESSVQTLIECCVLDEGKLYWQVSSPTIKEKPVQIRPWKLLDADFVMDDSQPLDPRKTIFVGGVPRPLKAIELAMIIDRLYGGVCYAGIDTDPELKYPKGAGRVAFSNQQSYIAAISARFVQLQHGDIDKRVEVKPYVLDDQLCDECQGVHCLNKFAPYFCANVTCLQYYCEKCWFTVHARQGRQFHKPLVKEGADRPRVLPFRW